VVKWVNQLHEGISLHIAWHSSGLSTNLSWSRMLFSERSQAPSEKSQHAPLAPERGEQEAGVENRREKINHFAKEGEDKEEQKVENFGSLRLIMIMCQSGTIL